MDLNNDVKYVKGVGPNRVVLLNKQVKLQGKPKDVFGNNLYLRFELCQKHVC